MHKYFNFTKIFEAEQAGIPLNPTEMGMDAKLDTTQPTEKIEDFQQLAATSKLEVTFNKEDIEKMEKGEPIEKSDAQWKNRENETEITGIKKVIFNTSNSKIENDPEALVFNLSQTEIDNIKGISSPEVGNITQVLNGMGKEGTVVENVEVSILRSTDLDTTPAEEAIPATPEQIEKGAVLPKPTEGEIQNESNRIMKFDQFVNEGKKKEKWIGEINMKEGALKKEMKDDSLTMSDLNKKAAQLKKKDKDKKKPGAQLDKKDAKTYRRITLAKNLMKASGASKK